MMGDMDPDFKAEVQTQKLNKSWSLYKHKQGSIRLVRAIIRTHWGESSLN